MSSIFQKIEPVSKKARIVALLREAIISGAMERGEQIVEAKLARQFGVGQGLIREALIELEHQGFVQRTPFSGTNVSILTFEDVQKIFEVRIELESLAFYLAGMNANERDLAELTELAKKTSIAFESKDLNGFFGSHLSFRKKIWQLSGNRYLQQALERIVIPLYALYLIRSSYNPEGLAMCIEVQDKSLDAFRRKDIDHARHVTRDFLVRMREYLGTRFAKESENTNQK
jgi:DNA-binding GntR family transcriptional regulator